MVGVSAVVSFCLLGVLRGGEGDRTVFRFWETYIL